MINSYLRIDSFLVRCSDVRAYVVTETMSDGSEKNHYEVYANIASHVSDTLPAALNGAVVKVELQLSGDFLLHVEGDFVFEAHDTYLDGDEMQCSIKLRQCGDIVVSANDQGGEHGYNTDCDLKQNKLRA